MSDEYMILNLDALANERVARDLHPPAHLRALLNLHEGADFRLVADLAPVEVHEIEDPDVLSELDVRRDRLEPHTRMRRPWARSDWSAASSSATTRTPAAASVRGVRFSSMDSANSWATSDSASRRSSSGACMSPVRYEIRICRRV